MMVLRRNPSIEEAPLQDELMLFDPASAKFFVLNTTMAFLWRQCDGKKSLPEIVTALVDEFDGVDPATAKNDLGVAATELSSLGLLLPDAS
jgi:hypothetical protein